MNLRFKQLIAQWPRLVIALHDLFMVWLCWELLHLLRYAMTVGRYEFTWFSIPTIIVLVAQGTVFWWVGLYRGLWRFASVPDMWNIFKASLLGLMAIVLGLMVYNRLSSVPRTVLILYPFVLTSMLGLPRLLYRAWKDYQSTFREGIRTRVLVLGAGQAAEVLIRDLRRSKVYYPVGFLDDAPHLRGSRLQGIPILGRLEEAPVVARQIEADMLVIAMPSLDLDGMRRVVEICEQTRLPFRTVPRLADVLDGLALPGELKEVAIEDLLGRDPVIPDLSLIQGWLGDRAVLVTGAGGSIGSELCRQCAHYGVRSIVLLEISEFALLRIRQELERTHPNLHIVSVLGDCGDPAVARRAVRLARPDAVFHAAAYKQVPMLEQEIREAVRNNVLATETVARICIEAKISTFVFISTDKAVEPANILGASKRFAEKVCQSLDNDSSTRFITVRFGNVLDSVGSVVPLFREQIHRGGPVTVTDPEVTRYFMTIPEACQLILQAGALGSRGTIYTLDMGAPVPIRLLAEQMIRLAGKQPGRDIEIVYTGLRPGEKLHETLFYKDERYCPTAHPKIFEAGARKVPNDVVLRAVKHARDAVVAYDEKKLREILFDVIPEFVPAETNEQPQPAVTMATVVPFQTRGAG